MSLPRLRSLLFARGRRLPAALTIALVLTSSIWFFTAEDARSAGALLVVLPQLLAWKALYGRFIASPQGEGFMRWSESAWPETLLSSRNGLFPWAPLYAIGFIGLFAALRRHPRLGSALLGGVLLQAFANGAAWDWWAGGSFGGRRFDSCFIAFSFGLGFLLLRERKERTKAQVSSTWVSTHFAARPTRTSISIRRGPA